MNRPQVVYFLSGPLVYFPSGARIPEDIAAHLAALGENLSRAALEAFALEAYSARKLSTAQLRRLLGYHTRTQVHGFLKEHGVYLHSLLSKLGLPS
jgi:hypothetical protein